MARYKIGTTEHGDAGLDLSWASRLRTVDGAIVITKCVSPDFRDVVITHKDRLVVHATVTGYGRSVLEPNVPLTYESLIAVHALVQRGFPREKIVIRVDPIIPTPKGISTAKETIKLFMDFGFSRFRVSIIDMYPHVIERFRQAKLPSPYGAGEFSPNEEQIRAVDKMLNEVSEYWRSLPNRWLLTDELRIEGCAEPGLTNVIQCGCVSDYDLALLGLSEDDDVDSVGYQRPHCMCYSGKKELLKGKSRCGHKCLYCFWQQD